MSDVREEIYNNYKLMIYNYFYKSTLNFHTAEDLTEGKVKIGLHRTRKKFKQCYEKECEM